MDEKRFRSILSGLNDYDLTMGEKRFVEAVKHHFKEKGGLTDQQETILEGIYREKMRWERDGIIFRKNGARNSARHPA